MKSFNKIFVIVLLVIVAVLIGTNIYFLRIPEQSGRQYRVEISRLVKEISDVGLENIELSKYEYVTDVVRKDTMEKDFFEGDGRDYVIKEIDGKYYRFDYVSKSLEYRTRFMLAANIVLGIMAVLVVVAMICMRYKLLKPFNMLKEIPYELSKGNLTMPLKEDKSRFFGRFIWGMDLLRENIEGQKVRELELQKEKKTLILSISHDIKTPLSAIKLYSKALSKKLYKTEEKQHEIAESINAKADEIENFISQIIKASSEDFLDLQVENTEFYLTDLITKIKNYYSEKLLLLHINFAVGDFSNCLLCGDLNRSIEVLQNIIENAIKYGDGHKISIEFSREEECQLVTVTNSGCTLSENEIPHMFDSFWRGSNVSTSNGSGLGLYICRQLMNKMNGDIYAHMKGEEIEVACVFEKM